MGGIFLTASVTGVVLKWGYLMAGEFGVCIDVYVCMCVCMYVCLKVGYVMAGGLGVCIDVYVCMCVCMYVCLKMGVSYGW